MTSVSRGRSGVPPPGTRAVHLDRAAAGQLEALRRESYDVVVDVSSQPSAVGEALDALADHAAHWVYISSGAAYADQSTPRQRADSAPLRAAHPAASVGSDFDDGEVTYGARKVSCERLVTSRCGGRATIVRPGLIVGPGDHRFGYWPYRLAQGGDVLAPGSPVDAVQWIDVRDLAAWAVRLAEEGVAGSFDAAGPSVPRAEFLTRMAAGLRVVPRLVWVDQDFLLGNGVQAWAGRRSLPLWVPLPDFAGCLDRDVTASLAAGLRPRDLAAAAQATVVWHRMAPGAHRLAAGLTREEEHDLLSAFRPDAFPRFRS